MVWALRAFATVSLLLGLGVAAGCGGSSKNAGGITVTVTPSTASLAVATVQQFTATVANDSTGRGVSWTLTQNGTACAPTCGSLFPTVTASGAPTTYTAPAAVVGVGGSAVTITATAVANTNATAAATIVIGGSIAVSVTPPTVTLPLSTTKSSTQFFSGAALNDTTTDGLTWGLSQNGTACSPGCGTISVGATISCDAVVATTTAPPGGFCTANPSGVTYTAPSTAPSSDAVVKLTATDIAAPGSSGWALITLETSVMVSISPTYANVGEYPATQKFTATVANDATNNGVNWSLAPASGATCSGTSCGTLSSTSSASGSSITYTAPSTPTTVNLTATSAQSSAESTYATIVVQPIMVTVAPLTAILYANETAPFTATVDYDSAEKGVTWTLLQNGTSCPASTCGSISPTSTTGGVQFNYTYTAPNTISTAITVTLVATSVTDNTKSASATISLYPPATVAVSPTTDTIAIGSRGSFTATVVNDPTNAGVSWSLTQSGKACAPTCGTVAPASTASGVPTVYIAPTSMPSSSTVTLTATSDAELSQSAAATITLSTSPVAKLSGNYAFSFSGSDSAGPVLMAGSFTADGAGNVTGGLADVNSASGVALALPLAGTYTVAPDDTGSLTLASPSQPGALATFRFSLNGSGDQARFIESDSSGTRGWGTMHRQSAAKSAAALSGDYAFSATGADPQGGRFVVAGRFHADGTGRIGNGVMDWNDAGGVTTELPFTGSDSVSSTGRGTLTANTPDGIMHWTFYTASPGDLVLVSADPRFAMPVSVGEVQLQAPGLPSGFTAASLDGTSVISLAGAADGAAGSKVEAGLVTFDGSGALRYSIDRNDGGKIAALAGNGSYSVDPNGRVTMWLSSLPAPLVSYLLAPNQGVVLGTGPGASAGSLDAQAPGPFSDASLSGGYVMGTTAAPSNVAPLETAVVTSTGFGTMGGMDNSTAAGDATLPAKSFQNVYSIAPSGRAVLGSGGSVLYLISASQGVVVDLTAGDAAGTIGRIEK